MYAEAYKNLAYHNTSHIFVFNIRHQVQTCSHCVLRPFTCVPPNRFSLETSRDTHDWKLLKKGSLQHACRIWENVLACSRKSRVPSWALQLGSSWLLASTVLQYFLVISPAACLKIDAHVFSHISGTQRSNSSDCVDRAGGHEIGEISCRLKLIIVHGRKISWTWWFSSS